MNFVNDFNFYGVEAQQIPCITGEGAPTKTTEGAVGCLYMDTVSGHIYKCVSFDGGMYVWENTSNPYEKYFDITVEGKISLKPEYRGAAGKKYYSNDVLTYTPEQMPYCISDNGVGNVGSKNYELPREISIPLKVNGITVTDFQMGIFAFNERITQVTLNPNITTIPSTFVYRAVNFEALHCTEQITIVKTASFSCTKIKKLEMPNLEKASGGVFHLCSQLEYVDMGKITALGNTVFDSCYKLKEIKIANPVTTIGNYTFHNCFNLRTIDNIVAPNITTSIGQDAFLMCKATYDWDKLVGCTFGQYATSNQSHTTRFWEGVNFTPCENRAKSFLSQLDTRWSDVPLVEGYNRTFATSCVPLSTMGVYCSLNNITIDDARDFPRICALNGTTITEVDGDYDLDNDADDFYAKMGLEVEYIEAPWNADKLETLYQALANGKYAVLIVPQGVGVYTGHALAVTGISPFGELLVQDPGNVTYPLEIPENASGRVPIQNLINTAGNHWSAGTKVAQILSKKAVT